MNNIKERYDDLMVDLIINSDKNGMMPVFERQSFIDENYLDECTSFLEENKFKTERSYISREVVFLFYHINDKKMFDNWYNKII